MGNLRSSRTRTGKTKSPAHQQRQRPSLCEYILHLEIAALHE
jgi:hypothetical protein